MESEERGLEHVKPEGQLAEMQSQTKASGGLKQGDPKFDIRPRSWLRGRRGRSRRQRIQSPWLGLTIVYR